MSQGEGRELRRRVKELEGKLEHWQSEAYRLRGIIFTIMCVCGNVFGVDLEKELVKYIDE